ncbi:MAG: hypothetical protein L0Y66_14225 [Myxococcaceae bacterium]|nr:hypothetical protein [Myxococcaceae bacterium]MCI0670087.1 hypothetical protein [Myxococcaceae bacterium]
MSEVLQQPAAKDPEDGIQDAEPRAWDSQELWLSLAQRQWRSLVLVPVDREASVGDMARALADIGTQLADVPVTAVLADGLGGAGEGTQTSERARTKALVHRLRSLREAGAREKLVVAVQPVTVESLGVLVAREADVVVLCVEMGRSRSEAVRRTTSLIGRERIAGCLVVE